MEIKFDIHTIKNADGKGNGHAYVQLEAGTPITDDELAGNIEASCSLTRADVKAVLAALRYHIRQELECGRRFHLPGIGYFSLSAGLSQPTDGKRVTGNDVWLRGINFLPESSLTGEVRKGVNFTRSKRATSSIEYTEDELMKKLNEYHVDHRFITRQAMRDSFGLSGYMADKWLTRLVGQGKLKKEGNRHAPLYFWA